MSQENVEIIQRLWEGYSEDGLEEAAVERLHPEVELMGAIGGMEEGALTVGRDAVSRALLADSEIWAERRLTRQGVIDAGDRVVVLLHEYRRGKGSGVEVNAEIALIHEFKDGMVARIEPYMSQTDALEAVGLSE